MGRKKIKIEPISDERNRTITFVKRKAGLFKKAHELAILCNADIAVIIFNNNNNNFYEYGSCDIKQLINNYQGSPNIHESRNPNSYSGEYAQLPNMGNNSHLSNMSNNQHRRINSTYSESMMEEDSDSEGDMDERRHKVPMHVAPQPQQMQSLQNMQYHPQQQPPNQNLPPFKNPVNNMASTAAALYSHQSYPSQTLQPMQQSIQNTNTYTRLPFGSGSNGTHMANNSNSNSSSNNNNNNSISSIGSANKPMMNSSFVFPPNKLPPISNNRPQSPMYSIQGANHVNSDSYSSKNSISLPPPARFSSSNTNTNNGSNNTSNNEVNTSHGHVSAEPSIIDKDTASVVGHSRNPSVNTPDFHRNSANIPYSAGSSPFTHVPRQPSSSRPVLSLKIPADNIKKDPEDSDQALGNADTKDNGLGRKESDAQAYGAKSVAAGKDAQLAKGDGANDSNTSSKMTSNSGSNKANSNTDKSNKSTPISATLPSAIYHFNIPNGTTSSSSNTNNNSNTGNGGRVQPSVVTNLPPATGGLLSSSIRPFLFGSNTGEQTPVSGLPSKYMNEFFPSPSNYYGEWNVGKDKDKERDSRDSRDSKDRERERERDRERERERERDNGSAGSHTPIRTNGIMLPLPSLSGSNSASKSSDSSLGKHSLNNPHGSIKDELPSPIVMPPGVGLFGNLSKDEKRKL